LGRNVVLSLYRIFTFEFSFRYLMGPVGIAQVSGQSAARGELLYLLWLLSANLGFINCVPFPLLDGGYLFLFLPYEILLRRKPSPRFVEVTQQIALGLLLLFIMTITYHDILRWMRPGLGG
jgi:regulator of sigma E protease